MPSMKNMKDFAEIIDPGFIDGEAAEINTSGDIYIGSDESFVIKSVGPVEVPMVDGSVGVFDSTGEFMGFKD